MQELRRACQLSPKQLVCGIWKELLPSFLTEMTTLLIILGMSPAYADEVSGILRVHANHTLMIRPVGLAVLALLSNAILDVTPERSSDLYTPPSDQKLQKHMAFFI